MKQPQQVFQYVDDTETSTGAEITAEALYAQFHVLCNNLGRSKRVTAIISFRSVQYKGLQVSM